MYASISLCDENKMPYVSSLINTSLFLKQSKAFDLEIMASCTDSFPKIRRQTV